MRNKEAQRYARWSLAMAGVVALAVAGVYARRVYLAHLAEKKAPPAVPSTIETSSKEFSFSKVEGQRTIYTVRASRATEFKDGNRDLLEDVEIVVHGKQGDRNDRVVTKACDFFSNTGKVTCAGAVQISLQPASAPNRDPQGVQVSTSALEFERDSGQVRTGQPVTFRWPGGSGRAVGMQYDANSGTLSLEHNIDLSFATAPDTASRSATPAAPPNAPVEPLELTGENMSFERDSRRVRVDGGVHARQDGRDLSADELLVELDSQFNARRIVASGRPHLRDTEAQGPIEVTADEIFADLRPDGSVSSAVASGSVHAAWNRPGGKEEITSGMLKVSLETVQNQPRELTASRGVVLTSTVSAPSAETRRVETDALDMRFSSRAAPGQVFVDTVETLAPAEVFWQSTAITNHQPVAQTTRMSGDKVTLKFADGNRIEQLVSTGDVRVTRKAGNAPEEMTSSQKLTANFDAAGEWATIDQTGGVRFQDGDRTGHGTRAHIDRAAGTVTVAGPVAFGDSATQTTADSASFNQSAKTMHADGHVLTTELRAASSVSNFAQEPAHVSADHLVSDTARGHAVYSGHGRMWQGPSVIEASVIELDNRTQTLVAKGDVRSIFPESTWDPKAAPGGRQVTDQTTSAAAAKARAGGGRSNQQMGRARGALLTYWQREARARIEGNAKVDSEQGSIQADRIDLFFTESGVQNAGKQLTRAIAAGNVVVEQEDRHGTSGRAEYAASEGKFVLSGGNPTLYSSTGDTTTGRELTFYFADDRIVVDSAEGKKTVTLHEVEK